MESSSTRSHNVFRELLDNPSAKHPRELQEDSVTKFPNEVASSNLKLLQPGSVVTDDAVILIGVASYSVFDLQLLDKVDQSAHLWSHRFKIYVFDIATFDTVDDLQSCLFGARFWLTCPDHRNWPPIRQTPIVLVLKAHDAIEFRQGVEPCQRLLAELGVL